jgi:hypothetical protein
MFVLVFVSIFRKRKKSMSVSIVSAFRWLDILEKEFDKAFVDLDLLLGEIDQDQIELTDDGRAKMSILSSCFAQLAHKAQTIFQVNGKLEVIKLIFLKNKFNFLIRHKCSIYEQK